MRFSCPYESMKERVVGGGDGGGSIENIGWSECFIWPKSIHPREE